MLRSGHGVACTSKQTRCRSGRPERIGRSLTPAGPSASRQLFALATPIALTQLAQVALTTVDIVMIAALGVEALAAGGLAIVLFNQVRTVGVGLITAAGNRVASIAAQEEDGALSEDAERGVRDVVRASLVLATAAGVVGAVLMVASGHALTWLTVVCIVVNAALNGVLGFGLWIFPRLELVGIGLATTLTHLLSFLLLCAAVNRDPLLARMLSLRAWLASPKTVRRLGAAR